MWSLSTLDSCSDSWRTTPDLQTCMYRYRSCTLHLKSIWRSNHYGKRQIVSSHGRRCVIPCWNLHEDASSVARTLRTSPTNYSEFGSYIFGVGIHCTPKINSWPSINFCMKIIWQIYRPPRVKDISHLWMKNMLTSLQGNFTHACVKHDSMHSCFLGCKETWLPCVWLCALMLKGSPFVCAYLITCIISWGSHTAAADLLVMNMG
jgi:hypothetical protein